MPEGREINGGRLSVRVPLEEWAREIAHTAGKKAAVEVLAEFRDTREQTCPMQKRVGKLWVYLAVLAAVLSGLGVRTIYAMFVR